MPVLLLVAVLSSAALPDNTTDVTDDHWHRATVEERAATALPFVIAGVVHLGVVPALWPLAFVLVTPVAAALVMAPALQLGWFQGEWAFLGLIVALVATVGVSLVLGSALTSVSGVAAVVGAAVACGGRAWPGQGKARTWLLAIGAAVVHWPVPLLGSVAGAVVAAPLLLVGAFWGWIAAGAMLGTHHGYDAWSASMAMWSALALGVGGLIAVGTLMGGVAVGHVVSTLLGLGILQLDGLLGRYAAAAD